MAVTRGTAARTPREADRLHLRAHRRFRSPVRALERWYRTTGTGQVVTAAVCLVGAALILILGGTAYLVTR